MSLSTKDFVEKFYPFALACEQETGLSAVATLTQLALETGFGNSAPGNNYFGVKADATWKGKRQLLKTTESFKSSDREKWRAWFSSGGREIVSIKENYKAVNGVSRDLWTVRTYFRLYDSPYDSFLDRYQFFVKNTRYKDALAVKGDYNRFFEEIHKAGYATGPKYSETLKSLAVKIIQYIPE